MPTPHISRRATTVERLIEAACTLDDSQIELVCEMVDAFRWHTESSQNVDSDLVTNGFGESLLNRLRLHHATSEEKFNKTSFEFAFRAASQLAGRHAVKTLSHTFQGADVVVDNVRWSLKTEGAAKILANTIKISKFSEARWIRGCVTADDFCRETKVRLARHLGEYDRILMLRGFYVDNATAVRYDLVEVPHEMLRAVSELVPDDFSPRTSAGSSSAMAAWRGRPAFKVVLDGSVEKVSLTNIKVSDCLVHATWTVPVLPRRD